GGCAWCHTPLKEPDPEWTPEQLVQNYKALIDTENLLTGGRTWDLSYLSDEWAKVSPVHSQNITSHREHGLGKLTISDIVTEIRLGLDPGGDFLCPPMPAGQKSAYGGIKKEDAKAIARYLKNAAPNMSFPANDDQYECKPPTSQ
ncbi:MAG: hypothetical protein ABEN55_22705, partial [Bradymonadaceae bacterium]